MKRRSTEESRIVIFFFPAIIQCFSSSLSDVQSLTGEVLIRQIETASDVSSFLYIYTRDGLKSANVRICVKSIEILPLLLSASHKNEDLCPMFEFLLELCQDQQFRSVYRDVLIRSIEHFRRILTNETIGNYLENFSNSLRRTYSNFVLPEIQNRLDQNDEANRSSTPNFESTEIKFFIETIRANWISFEENERIEHLNRLKSLCDQFYHSIQQYLSKKNERNFNRALEPCLSAIFELLQNLTSTNLELSIKVKLILFTCLAWLIKYSSVSFNRKNRKALSTIFKKILTVGNSNNRQLAVRTFRSEENNQRLFLFLFFNLRNFPSVSFSCSAISFILN